MRRILLALLTLSTTVIGCSIDSEGTGADLPVGEADTGTVSADGEIPGADTAVVDDSSTVDSTVDDTTVADSTVDDTTVADTTVADTTVVDTFVADTFVADTFVADTFVADTFVADTFVADTFVADTFVADTFVADTFVADTFVADTFVADTFVADTFVADTYVPPVLSCTATAPSSSVDVNLTTEGTIDWAHWGQGGAGGWNHKTGGTAITKGTASGATWWGTYPTKFTWTNGTPTGSVTATTQGIYQDVKGDSFSFEVAGDPAAERTLVVYTTWNGSTASIAATLSDGSAPAANGTIPPTGATGSGIRPVLYTCKFRPATTGAKLSILITHTSTGAFDATSLLAATLR